tara:strand:- start:2920 stop:3270 length:351 start_codon:yes stop_codon:yes gene_type:complete
MPRQPVGEVTEHRVTLGDFERRELAKVVERFQVDQDRDFGIELAKALSMPVSVVLTGYLTYLGLMQFQTGRDRLNEWFGSAAKTATGEPGDLWSRIVNAVSGLAVFQNLDDRNPNL